MVIIVRGESTEIMSFVGLTCRRRKGTANPSYNMIRLNFSFIWPLLPSTDYILYKIINSGHLVISVPSLGPHYAPGRQMNFLFVSAMDMTFSLSVHGPCWHKIHFSQSDDLYAYEKWILCQQAPTCLCSIMSWRRPLVCRTLIAKHHQVNKKNTHLFCSRCNTTVLQYYFDAWLQHCERKGWCHGETEQSESKTPVFASEKRASNIWYYLYQIMVPAGTKCS